MPLRTATTNQNTRQLVFLGTTSEHEQQHARKRCAVVRGVPPARTYFFGVEVGCELERQPGREPVGHVEEPARLAFGGVRAVVDLHGEVVKTARADALYHLLDTRRPARVGYGQEGLHPPLGERGAHVVRRDEVVKLARRLVHLAHQRARRRQQRDLELVLRAHDVVEHAVEVSLGRGDRSRRHVRLVGDLGPQDVDERRVVVAQLEHATPKIACPEIARQPLLLAGLSHVVDTLGVDG